MRARVKVEIAAFLVFAAGFVLACGSFASDANVFGATVCAIGAFSSGGGAVVTWMVAVLEDISAALSEDAS